MKKAINILRFILVITVFTAIIGQIIYSTLNVPGFSPANFFSFFTVESNIFAAVVLLISAYVSLVGKPSRRLEYFRGAATMYMVVVGVIYFLLLRGSEGSLNTPLPSVNFVLHYLFPAYILIDWVVSPLTHTLRFKKALLWLVFPIAYLAYSLIRGPIAGWYPYPFIDPHGPNGVMGIVGVSIAIAAFCVGLTWFITRKPEQKRSKNTKSSSHGTSSK